MKRFVFHVSTCGLLGLGLVAMRASVGGRQPANQPSTYTAIAITDASGAAQGPRGLNNLGDILGSPTHSLSDQTGATILGHDGFLVKRPGALAGGDYSGGSAINDSGEVAGVANTANAIIPFISTPSRGTQRIPLLPGDKAGQAFSINQFGNVVGYSSGPSGIRAFLWMRGSGAVQNLGTLPGGSASKARDINDSNMVVGTVRSASGDRAVLWTKVGNVRDLGTLPGDTSSEATAINNAGDVVGYSNGPQGNRAFLWTKTTGMQNLGVLPGGNFSRALHINDDGVVVGASTSSSGDRAFLWRRGVGMRDLNEAVSNDVGAVFIEAHAINNKGQILVMGMTRDDPNTSANARSDNICAPAPEATYLLVPNSPSS
jgi:probable HAF family extracellular repeat protein